MTTQGSSDTHQFLAVLLPCAGAEQLHVEEGEDSQQLGLQVVGLEHEEKGQRQSVGQEVPHSCRLLDVL